MTKSEPKSLTGWSIPIRLDNVPDDGLHVAVAADAATCAAVAKLVGVDAVLRLEVDFEVVRHGQAGMAVMGGITARVRQTCVLTLDIIENDVNEPVGVTFAVPSGDAEVVSGEVVIVAEADNAPEPLVNGTADLGLLATEYLMLAIDRYPRKPGVEFQPPPSPDPGGSPFDALAVLKKDGNQTS